MKTVTRREALKGLSRFLRDAYVQDKVTRSQVKAMRRLIDAVLEADANGTNVRIMGDDVYGELVGHAT